MSRASNEVFESQCTFYNNRVDIKTNKTQSHRNDAPISNDYEQGLRILARIIARLHMEKALNKKERTDSAEEDTHDNSKPVSFGIE